jgi:two-component system alkaline phosphatase synthesis response regulator PhoP
MQMSEKILIVEDESKIVRTLRLYLERSGFEVAAVYDGAQAVPAFRRERPALILLDLNLPGADGLDVCRALRRESNVPIIMITARIEEADRLVGLELGADDYVVKPFSPREVVARVRAVLRRVKGSQSNSHTIRVGALLLDLAGHRAWIDDKTLALTQTEFELLRTLAENAGRVLSRLQLLDEMAGISYEGFERTVDQHVKNLRRKIKESTGLEQVIQTVYGVGYRLDSVEFPEVEEDRHVS